MAKTWQHLLTPPPGCDQGRSTGVPPVDQRIDSHNTGIVPVDTQDQDGRNTGKLPVGHKQVGCNIGVIPVDQQHQEQLQNDGSPSTQKDDETDSYAEEVNDHSQCDVISMAARSIVTSPAKSRGSASKSRSHHTPVKGPPKKASVLEADQEYWARLESQYQSEEKKLGPEVNSSLAGATKVFWQNSINEDKLQRTLESSRVPSNCTYLSVQQVNKEIWSCTSGDICTKDWSLQKVQEMHGAMSANIIQAANLLYKIKAEFAEVSKDLGSKLNPAIDKLRDALILAGKSNLQLNTHRREAFKPSIPADLKRLVDKPTEDSRQWLFGDNIKERLAEIRGENSIRQEFMKKDNITLQKRTNTYKESQSPA